MSFNINDILEREWWLMYHLHIGYNDIENMSWEYVEWFYNRQVQEIIDKTKEMEQYTNSQ